jgi:hypothetical protein
MSKIAGITITKYAPRKPKVEPKVASITIGKSTVQLTWNELDLLTDELLELADNTQDDEY